MQILTIALPWMAGLFRNRPPAASLAGINLASSGASHSMPACRVYYSQSVIEPQKAINYKSENRNKKVGFKTFISNQYNNQAPKAVEKFQRID